MSAVEDWRRGDPAEHVVEADPQAVKAELRRRLGKRGPTWHLDAACLDEPTSTFFPERGGSNKRALEICGRCTVRTICLAEALADVELDYGIRGGMTASVRKAHRRAIQARSNR